MAREGWPFVLGCLAAAVTCVALWYAVRRDSLLAVGVLAFVFALFCIFFFRDPERVIPAGDALVVSPGDGRVVEIVTEDDLYVGDGIQRVSIFLSVFSVHVNRVPVAGRVTAVDYRPGRYLMAFNEKASADNEQTHIAIESQHGVVAFKQIAGLIARRIVCSVGVGDVVETGQRCGLIRFGSRVDVMLPATAQVHVRKGQAVKGGETIIGVLR